MTKKHSRVFGYARVSSTEQALGTSLSDQQDAIRREAERRGLALTRFFVEAESGVHEKFERREQIQALMKDVRSGDLVLVDKLDRWSRDPEFTWRSVRVIHEAGASVYFVSEQCDPSTPQGDTALNFRIALAREEHKRIKERMVGTRNLLRARGLYAAGATPFGYRRQTEAPNRLDRNRLVVVPEEAAIVRDIFQRYVTGQSMNKIAAELSVFPQFVQFTLHKRVYLGEVQGPPSSPGKADGQWFQNCHEPIIDRQTWERTQETINARRLGGPRPRDAVSETSDWLLRDVARCGRCNAKMIAVYGGPKDRRNYYYRCRAKCKAKGPLNVRVDEVEERGAELVVERLALLRDELANPSPVSKRTKKPAEDFEVKRAALKRRRERHLEAHAAELMTLEELRAALTKLDSELVKLDEKEAAQSKPVPLEDPKVQRALLGQLRELSRAFAHSTPAEQRAIVNLLTESCGLVAGYDPSFEWRELEHVRAHLDSVREGLLRALQTAPTHGEVIDALFESLAR